ncbi:MAG: hypothetical protein ACRD04_06675 [Terriglobales bacterium]
MQVQKLIPVTLAAVLGVGLGAALGTPAAAQSNRIVVPLSHPSQPATVRASTLNGAIVVRAYNGDQVIIVARGRGADHSGSVPPGMHQLNASPGVSASEDNNVINVHFSIFNGGNERLVIQVPVHSSLRLTAVSGLVEVVGVTGDISAENTNGAIRLENVSGSVVASAVNGTITASIAHLDETKPSSFSSMNGVINVTLPPSAHADLSLKTVEGSIYMDNGFNFQQTPVPGPESARGNNGMFRIRVNRTVAGTLNGGGPQIRVQNFNGSIYIHKGQ